MTALPPLLPGTGPPTCSGRALGTLIRYDDEVRVAVLPTESAPRRGQPSGAVYEGAADVYLNPQSLTESPAGDAGDRANALVYLPGAPAVPDGAVLTWVSDHRGRAVGRAGTVVGTRPDGALLTHFRS